MTDQQFRDGTERASRPVHGFAPLGRARRMAVRALATLGLLSFGFMLVFVVGDAWRLVGEQAQLAPPGSVEAEIGASHPGEAVHIVGAASALVLGGSGLIGLIIRPQRAGSAVHTASVAIAMLAAATVTGNPDNYGGQAGAIDPAFAVLAVPPLAAALLAAPWRAWRLDRARRPGLLLLAALGIPGLWYGIQQGLMQRRTWPPTADPHHQAHWWAMSLLAFLTVLAVAGASLPGRGWRAAAVASAVAAIGVSASSLLSPSAGSALHPAFAVAAALWAAAVLLVVRQPSASGARPATPTAGSSGCRGPLPER